MKAQAKGAAAGYREAQQIGAGVRDELARIIRENLPTSEGGKLLGDVARADSVGKMALVIRKAGALLADHDVKQAIGRVESLVGGILPPVYGPKDHPAYGPKNQPRGVGQVLLDETGAPKVRGPVDLTKLSTEPLIAGQDSPRDAVRKLINVAKVLRGGLKSADTLTEKYAAIDRLQKVERQIREVVANDAASKEITVNGKRQATVEVVANVLKNVNAPEPAVNTQKVPEANPLRRLGRVQMNMDAISANLDKDASGKGPLSSLAVTGLTKARNDYLGETRRFNEHFGAAMEKAGYKYGTRAFDQFLSKTEPLDLPDAGKTEMTRQQMVGLVSAAGDQKTAELIRSGVRWTFQANPNAEPFKITPRDIEAIYAKLTPGERDLIPAFKHYVEENLRNRTMAAAVNLRGWAPEPHEGYQPQKTNRKAAGPVEPAGWRGVSHRSLENISSVEERTSGPGTVLFVPEFVEDAIEHVHDAAQIIHLAEPVRSVAMVLEHPEVRRALEQKYGTSMTKRVGQFLEDAMGVDPANQNNIANKTSAFLSRQLARTVLPLNWRAIGKNVLGGSWSLMPEFESRDLIPSITSAMSPATYREMHAASNIVWERYHGAPFDRYSSILSTQRAERLSRLTLGEAMKGVGGELLRLNPVKAARKLGSAIDALPFMDWADSVPLRVAWEASKRFIDRTQPNLSGDARQSAVLEKFHQAIQRTQNGASPVELSGASSMLRRIPWLQPLLMFTSDNNKKFNMLARARYADNTTRAKTMLAIAGNALIASGVTAGSAYGLVKLGHAIGGNPNPADEKKLKTDLAWNSLSELLQTSYGGDKIAELIHGYFGGKGGKADFSTPPERMTADWINVLSDTARGLYAAAGHDSGSIGQAKGYSKALTQTEKLATNPIVGNPLSVVMNAVHKVEKAAAEVPLDPRMIQKKEQAAELKQVRDNLPADVANLLTERRHLDSLSRQLSDAEIDRRADLQDLVIAHKQYLLAIKEGDKAEADQAMAEMKREAAKAKKVK